MPYYIEPSKDSYGNTGWPLALIEAHIENDGYGQHLVIDGPPEIQSRWPTCRLDNLTNVGAAGPPRMLSHEEWEALGGLTPNPDTHVPLADGGDPVDRSLMIAVMVSLRDMRNTHPTDFYDLVMLCRDPANSSWSPQQRQRIRDLGLIEGDGQPHSEVRRIILAATTGDGLNLRLTR